MDKVVFDDKYKLEIPIIDYEHEKLFTIINDIIAASKDNDPNNLLYEINIAELIKYADFHFRSEEDLMIEAKYEGYADHKKAHDAFREKIQQFQREFNEKKLDVEKLIDYLVSWLTTHIMVVDKKYEDTLKDAGIDKQLV